MVESPRCRLSSPESVVTPGGSESTKQKAMRMGKKKEENPLGFSEKSLEDIPGRVSMLWKEWKESASKREKMVEWCCYRRKTPLECE